MSDSVLTISHFDEILTHHQWFATWEGHVGASVLEASLFVKLCAFVVRIQKVLFISFLEFTTHTSHLQFIQTFLVSALSGSVTAELSNILDNPEDIVSILANSLPAQSSYFMQVCREVRKEESCQLQSSNYCPFSDLLCFHFSVTRI